MEPRDPFEELADEARAADDVRRRTASGWLRRRAAEEATVLGTLLDLAERRTPLALRTRSGRVHRGAIEAVGADFVAIGSAWVRTEAVVSVQPAPGAAAGAGPATGRGAPRDVRLAEALSELAAERPRVVVVPAGGAEALRGELRSVGVDVLTVVLDGPDAVPCHISLGAVAEIVVDAAG